jgi:hypothetical protein
LKSGGARKFRKKWKGPFRIVNFVTPKTVVLGRTDSRKLLEPVQLRRLKVYRGPKLVNGKIPKNRIEPEKINSDDMEIEENLGEENGKESEEEEEYVIEDFVEKCITEDDIVLWKVKWEGYPIRDATWEPDSNIQANDMKREFEKEAKICNVCKVFWARKGSVLGSHKRSCDGKALIWK